MRNREKSVDKVGTKGRGAKIGKHGGGWGGRGETGKEGGEEGRRRKRRERIGGEKRRGVGGRQKKKCREGSVS